ncbi:hypothetical protein PSTEL_04410 [Paenibacillus stellifer]|uniref:Uncharacterized protein n=1 Tax=Paenibacillus stellifer TaxID=169760 RepID=A0A089LTD3_9BACL|nr:hypothetical protein [Paenibacillus stellifer]AIQ62463.1 hypothetical protein PSTEL_04410 [Paenibacillus stellifer]
MGVLIWSVLVLGLIINLLVFLKYEKKTYWERASGYPTSISFLTLIMGFSGIGSFDQVYKLDNSTYKMALGYLFSGVMVMYIVLLITRLKRYS